MKLKILFIVLSLGLSSFAQISNEELAKKAINYLDEGNTMDSYTHFLKLLGMDDSPVYKGYLSYTYTKVSLFEDSVNKEGIEEAKRLSEIAYKADSNNYVNKYAYTSTLYLIAKNSSSLKEKAKLLVEIKQNLDQLVKDKNVNADVYNLLAIWNREVASFDSFEQEMMNTFFKEVPKGGTFEEALKMHKKAFNLNNRAEYKYELAITYKNIGLSDLYINTLNEGRDIHGSATDDVYFQKKCDNLLPKLSD